MGTAGDVTQYFHNTTYTYDPTGRRTTKPVDGLTTQYLYDGDRVLEEYDATEQLLRRYIYGPGLDEPLVMDTGGDRYYYHFDALGSVVALSDETGTTVERYAYGPFGEGTEPSALGNPYRYAARRFDAETGLYYYRARYYSPELGRFLQVDPIGYADGMNLYAYVGNDPLNFVDPLGLAGLVSNRYSLVAQQRVTTTTNVDEATGAHNYRIRGKICSGGAGCDAALADKVFGHVNQNDVPFTDNDLGSGPRSLIPGLPRPFGSQPVFHSENVPQRTSTNVTLEGHNFHPGSVTHRVHFEDGTLYYDVVGTGTGQFPSFNNFMGIFLFRPGVVDAVNKFGR